MANLRPALATERDFVFTKKNSLAPVAQACSPSYSGGEDQENGCSRSAQPVAGTVVHPSLPTTVDVYRGGSWSKLDHGHKARPYLKK
jgi:hypothetical protein